MQRQCDVCGSRYEAKRKDSRTCSATCRSNKRRGAAAVEAAGQASVESNSLVKATTVELEAAGKVDTALGQLALSLAASMSKSVTGIAALSRELRSVLDAAVAVAPGSAPAGKGDTVDELRARRDAKRAG